MVVARGTVNDGVVAVEVNGWGLKEGGRWVGEVGGEVG